MLTLGLLPGCQPANIAPLEERVAQLEGRVATLEAGAKTEINVAVQATPSTASTPSAESTVTPTPAVTETPSAVSTDSLWKTLNYTDLPSAERLKEIASFGFLPKGGITNQEQFIGEITRGQYVALLVEMNNAVFQDGEDIRLAQPGDAQAFDDVPSSHPYYKYIQGMVDAGYVIGFNEKSFQPDKVLTREEMVAIAAKRDFTLDPESEKYLWDNYTPFVDKEEIAPKYRLAISKDNGESISNLQQAFGALKKFQPKKPVKGYEAVLSLYRVGNHGDYHYDRLVEEKMK